MVERRKKTEQGIENVRQDHIVSLDLMIISETILRELGVLSGFIICRVKKIEMKSLNSNCKETECASMQAMRCRRQNEASTES